MSSTPTSTDPETTAASTSAPTDPSETPTKPLKKFHVTPDAKNRLCRNVIVYGYCNKQDKGCPFNHDQDKPDKKTLKVTTPAFIPSGQIDPVPSLSAATASVPTESGISSTETPSNVDDEQAKRIQLISSYTASFYPNRKLSIDSPSVVSGEEGAALPTTPADQNVDALVNEYEQHMNIHDMGYEHGMNYESGYYDTTDTSHHAYMGDHPQYYYPMTLSTPTITTASHPLNYHLYVSPLPHTNSSKLNRQQKTIHTFFMADDLREELTKRNQELAFVVDDTMPEYQSLPAEVYNYHSLYPIESSNPSSETNYFGYATQVYRSTSSVDGLPYCLRKIEGFRLLNETAMTSLDPWRRIRHPSIVNVREAFTTKAFGDYSLVFVYDYHPCSTTLYTKHFAQSTNPGSTPGASSSSTSRRPPTARSNSTVSSRETEAILWSYIAQICSALKAIHGAGLAARVIDPSKILVTGKNRIRLNCCGIWDMVTFENYNTKTGNSNVILQYQQEDLLAFGQLLVNLACSSLTATSSANLNTSLENISRNFSAEFSNFLAWLLSKPSSMKRIDDGVALISGRLMTEMDSCRAYADTLESELSKELENGRIARLLCKMGFINERPEFDMDTRWSETGDRYLIKLFRDYVFHQVDENGNPVLNMAHVLSCLNKVDVGIDERVMLMSRDERNCLIVSYKELKQCVEGAFSELLRST